MAGSLLHLVVFHIVFSIIYLFLYRRVFHTVDLLLDCWFIKWMVLAVLATKQSLFPVFPSRSQAWKCFPAFIKAKCFCQRRKKVRWHPKDHGNVLIQTMEVFKLVCFHVFYITGCFNISQHSNEYIYSYGGGIWAPFYAFPQKSGESRANLKGRPAHFMFLYRIMHSL